MDVDSPALPALAGSNLDYRVVRTRPARSAEESAELQGIELRELVRTIVVRRGADDYVFVLVPGGREIDWPKLRAHLGVSRVSLPDQDEAKAATGYERGAITPFGSSRAWPVIADATVAGLERVAIGGGARGVNLHLPPTELIEHLRATVADVTRPERNASSSCCPWTCPPTRRPNYAAARRKAVSRRAVARLGGGLLVVGFGVALFLPPGRGTCGLPPFGTDEFCRGNDYSLKVAVAFGTLGLWAALLSLAHPRRWKGLFGAFVVATAVLAISANIHDRPSCP